MICTMNTDTTSALSVSEREPFPKALRQAVLSYARAVRRVADLSELPSPDPLTEYHYKEYLDEMETLLVHQLLTALPTREERDAVLSVAGLEYLSERVRLTGEEWEA